MTSENLILNGLHFSFEIFIWISFFLQCSMFVVAFLPKIKIGAKFKIISRNHSSTISCKNCNWQLQSDFAIYSCSYSSYQLKKIATKSCLQMILAIHDFLQLIVALWLLSGCNYLQCGLKILCWMKILVFKNQVSQSFYQWSQRVALPITMGAMIKTHIGINTIDFFTTLNWYHSTHD